MIEKRNNRIINKKFIQYLIPSILMIFAMQLCSLFDGILVGNLISQQALAATSLVMPILFVIQAPGFSLGLGGAIVIANKLGKRDLEGAKKVFSISLILGVGISILFAAIAYFVTDPLVKLFGEAAYNYAYPYVLIYLLTDPIVTLALLLGSFMAVDNSPRLSSIFFIVANVVKVGLEFLFIKVCGWEMYGAALSTGAGFLVAMVVPIFYIVSKKRMLKLTFKIKGTKIWEILKASSSSGLNMILTAVQMLVVNIFLGQLITDPVQLLTFGLISNIVFVFDLFCGGIVNVIPNTVGILYGEKDIYSLKKITRTIFWINIGVSVVITALIASLPGVYCYIFGYTEQTNLDIVAFFIRIYLIAFIPYEINKFSMNYYPSIDKNLPAIIVVVLREFVLVLPLTLSLLFTNGLLGYSVAYVATEAGAALITYIFILIYNKRSKTHGIFMFENLDNSEIYETTLDNNINNAALISEELTEFAKKHNVKERESQIVGLAAEEIVNNIITYGYKHNSKNYIDISLKIIENSLILRIRDDGMPFDPTKYEFDYDEKYSTSGIKLISQLTDKMTYMRVLSLNNTTFEINIQEEN